MKLIVTGATGFVAREVIRQALNNPKITSIVALARRETKIPDDAGPDAKTEKFRSVICDDFSNYPDSVKTELAGAHSCIWLLAITPTKANSMPAEQVRKVCLDYAMTGLDTIAKLPRDGVSQPLRFLYISGSSAERDPAKKPWILGNYSLMRGEVESQVLEYANKSNGAVEACVAKPGLIHAPGTSALAKAAKALVGSVISLPFVQVEEIAATLLNQATEGFEKETFLNEDLIRIGRKVLETQEGSTSANQAS
ncbi:hypothetical protein FZEAL_5726 [Fusarium zealandicum]|uniref:NAD(P)-binding domain-containing protein n=1 Tax=Fusarium zealandicum TaxID=1053134 RepID=A0A8H4XKB2_9HYPO|nr:hypothetical protein FZEAL_5726 [Fusarium zealandicum]